MDITRGWDLDEHALLRIRLLEWLYDYSHANPGRIPNINTFEPEYPNRAAVDRAASALLADGSSDPGQRRQSGKPVLQISHEGARLVEHWRAMRADSVERERNCEAAFVSWLYERRSAGVEHPVVTDFLKDRRATFYGDPFTEDEVSRATLYLRERGFINGAAGWGYGVMRPSLTATGIQYARGGGEPTAAAGGSTSYTTNFHGPISGMVGVGERVEQTQHQGVDAATLGEIFRAMRDAMGDIHSDDDRDDVELQIGALEAEASMREPDPKAIQHRVGRLRQIAGRIGNPAVAAAITTATTELLRALGVG